MDGQVAAVSEYSQRRRSERRRVSLRSLLYALVKTRRQAQRRSGSTTVPCYSDDYGAVLLAAALTLLLMSIADAFFTLILIKHGSVELNPLLAWALNKHVLLFFSLKYALTAGCVVLAVIHKNFRLFGLSGPHILFIALVGYGVLLHYQLSMLLPLWY